MQSNRIIGMIVRGTGGLYEADLSAHAGEAQRRVLCDARGIFRKDKRRPCVGDMAELTVTLADGEERGVIEELLPRRNLLIRPPVANVDVLFIVTAAASPEPSLENIDKLTAIAVHNGIEPVILINKTDLASAGELERIYRAAGFAAAALSARGEGFDASAILERLEGRVGVLCGASGVGKTTILNRILPGLGLSTGELSRKTDRGRHTTREVGLMRAGGGYIADTPGFSLIDFERFDFFKKEDLLAAFPDIERKADGCKFAKCSHTKEEGCAVLAALREGKVEASRHASYAALHALLDKKSRVYK